MSYTPAKHNLIFGKISSADFYPKGRDNEIDLLMSVPKDTRIWPGEVVILDIEIYQELLRSATLICKTYERMADAGFSKKEVKEALESGRIIEFTGE